MKLLEKLLHRPPHKSTPSKETLISWIKWSRQFCKNTDICTDCELNASYGKTLGGVPVYCIVGYSVLLLDPRKLPDHIKPKKPPKKAMRELVNLDNRSYVDSILYQS